MSENKAAGKNEDLKPHFKSLIAFSPFFFRAFELSSNKKNAKWYIICPSQIIFRMQKLLLLQIEVEYLFEDLFFVNNIA